LKEKRSCRAWGEKEGNQRGYKWGIKEQSKEDCRSSLLYYVKEKIGGWPGSM